jgi:hypothetical protein
MDLSSCQIENTDLDPITPKLEALIPSSPSSPRSLVAVLALYQQPAVYMQQTSPETPLNTKNTFQYYQDTLPNSENIWE